MADTLAEAPPGAGGPPSMELPKGPDTNGANGSNGKYSMMDALRRPSEAVYGEPNGTAAHSSDTNQAKVPITIRSDYQPGSLSASEQTKNVHQDKETAVLTELYPWYGKFEERKAAARTRGLTEKERDKVKSSVIRRAEKKGQPTSGEQFEKQMDSAVSLAVEKKMYRVARDIVKKHYDEVEEIVSDTDDGYTSSADKYLRSAFMVIDRPGEEVSDEADIKDESAPAIATATEAKVTPAAEVKTGPAPDFFDAQRKEFLKNLSQFEEDSKRAGAQVRENRDALIENRDARNLSARKSLTPDEQRAFYEQVQGPPPERPAPGTTTSYAKRASVIAMGAAPTEEQKAEPKEEPTVEVKEESKEEQKEAGSTHTTESQRADTEPKDDEEDIVEGEFRILDENAVKVWTGPLDEHHDPIVVNLSYPGSERVAGGSSGKIRGAVIRLAGVAMVAGLGILGGPARPVLAPGIPTIGESTGGSSLDVAVPLSDKNEKTGAPIVAPAHVVVPALEEKQTPGSESTPNTTTQVSVESAGVAERAKSANAYIVEAREGEGVSQATERAGIMSGETFKAEAYSPEDLIALMQGNSQALIDHNVTTDKEIKDLTFRASSGDVDAQNRVKEIIETGVRIGDKLLTFNVAGFQKAEGEVKEFAAATANATVEEKDKEYKKFESEIDDWRDGALESSGGYRIQSDDEVAAMRATTTPTGDQMPNVTDGGNTTQENAAPAKASFFAGVRSFFRGGTR